MTVYPAHIRTEYKGSENIDVVQTVEEHCRAAAHYAGASLAPVGLSQTANLAGLLHDFGKFTRKFSDYLWAAHQGKPVHRGSVNHTFAGVQYLFRSYCSDEGSPSPLEHLACELIGYAIGAHHGLFDLMQDQKEYGFPHRLSAENIDYVEAKRNFLAHCASQKELDSLFQSAVNELQAWIPAISRLCMQTPGREAEHLNFYCGMLARLLLSAVIEGDRRDTAEFEHHFQYPEFPANRADLWLDCLAYLERRLDTFPQEQSIQQARRHISDLCREKASHTGHLYRLNVPTGGGKTLASLRYALAHSAAHNKQRIFFIIPLLSIIDQNSKVIREFLPRQDIILEHHSNAVQTEEIGDELDPRELLAENWSAPVIITTLVQFLNTLFSGKTTSIRRFQALCNSVIVFDEVQTVPSHMLTLFNLAITFLTEFCGTTVVLCSATQPCLEQIPHALVHQPEELVPYDEALWAPFRRTNMKDAGACKLEELPERILCQLSQHRSLLVICNKKEEASSLCRDLQGRVPHLFHLSASMCMAHRRKTLEQLGQALSPESGIEHGILCISTQVIEAGVDISFSCVIRLLAGMDNAVQAAGRCNRNRESQQPAPVYLLQCADEQLTMLKDIQSARDASQALLEEFSQHPQRYRNDLSSDEAIRFYYNYLYRQMPGGAQDFPVRLKGGSLDTIFNLLSQNTHQLSPAQPLQFCLHQDFQTAGRAFRVFDQNTTDVLVPFDLEAEQLISDLCSERAAYDMEWVHTLLDAAKPYTISLYQWQLEHLSGAHALYPTAGQTALVLHREYYHHVTGLLMEPQADPNTEVSPCDFQI